MTPKWTAIALSPSTLSYGTWVERGPNETWAADFDTNGARAQQKAIAGCQARGGKSCKVEADPCSHD